MVRLATVEELKERLNKFTCLEDWIKQPVHEVITTAIPASPTEKEN
jgi:hypothetical protein